MNKPTYLKHATAKANGYFAANGENLKSVKLSQAQQDEWNGVEADEPTQDVEPKDEYHPKPEALVLEKVSDAEKKKAERAAKKAAKKKVDK